MARKRNCWPAAPTTFALHRGDCLITRGESAPACALVPLMPKLVRDAPQNANYAYQAVACPCFCCTTELLPPAPRARLRGRIPPQRLQVKSVSKPAHVQTNSDSKSRRDRL